MEYIIHLTDKCNLNCTYCYENKKDKEISFDHIKNLIDNEIKNGSKKCIIYFYGGEPLTKKEMIKDTINYINEQKSSTEFRYGITTNGTLLDEDFINYMKENNFINVAFSIDGAEHTQNMNRVTVAGNGTFDIVKTNAEKLLKVFDNAVAMSVITKNNLKFLGDNVKFLIDLGFKTINLQFNYLDKWKDEDLIEIRKQYNNLAEIYIDNMLKENDIKIPLLDSKIKSYVQTGYNCNEECKLGMKSINVGTDGNFYPCAQFVYEKEFVIGNCENGVDNEAREALLKNTKHESDVCANCSIRNRCKHLCSCKNYMLQKDINKVSPLTCETERIIIEIADEMAGKLYKQNSKMFIQKFYNKDFNVINKLANELA